MIPGPHPIVAIAAQMLGILRERRAELEPVLLMLSYTTTTHNEKAVAWLNEFAQAVAMGDADSQKRIAREFALDLTAALMPRTRQQWGPMIAHAAALFPSGLENAYAQITAGRLAMGWLMQAIFCLEAARVALDLSVDDVAEREALLERERSARGGN